MRAPPSQRTPAARVMVALLVSSLLSIACSAVLGPHEFKFTQCAVDADCTLNHACSASGVCYCTHQGFGASAVRNEYGVDGLPLAVIASDLNGDGRPDLVTANEVTHTVSVLLNNGNGTFKPKEDYATGQYPASVAAADLNRDGKPDLAVANSGGNTVSVLLGNGDGTFRPKVDHTTGVGPTSVAALDLNDDGKPDVVVTNGGAPGNTLSVLLGNGDGTFQPKHDYATGQSPTSVAAADVNGDGKPDLAVANSVGNTVSVLLGNGDGTFESKVDYATGAVPESVAAADLNGDGRPDLAVANFGALGVSGEGNTVSVLINTGDGKGTFEPKVDYAARANPTSVAVADLNGDGRLDLAVAARNDSVVTVLLNGGNGVFPVNGGSTYLAGSRVDSVAAADLNDDGKPDLVLAALSHVSVLLNENNDGFVVPSAERTGLHPVAVAASDLNGDGRPDLAIANEGSGTVSVFVNKGDGAFAPKVDYAIDDGGSQPCSVAAGDLNGDGIPDLAVANLGGNTVSVLINKGDGTFQAGVDYFTSGVPSSVASADLNGDGKRDLVLANEFSRDFRKNGRTISVMLNRGDGTFMPKVDYSTGAGPTSVAALDLNHDGKPDVVVTNGGLFGHGNTLSVLLGNGDGTFQARVDYATGREPVSVAAADLNVDGEPDLAVANAVSGTVSVLLNKGDGTFAPKVDYATGQGPSSVAVTDLNGDGMPDLTVANEGGNTVSVLFNKGGGTFAPQVPYPTGFGPVSIATADMNGDGIPDLAVTNGADDSVSVLITTCGP